MSSLFRKPKKTIQRRVFSENPEDEDADDHHHHHHTSSSSSSSRHSTKPAPKKEKDAPKKQNLLSFDAEEEGEVFQVKKSSYSKKMMRMYERERKRTKEPKDSLLKPHMKEDIKHEEDPSDLVVVVNHRMPSPPPPPILSGRDALCAGKNDLSSEDDDADEDDAHRFSKPDNFQRVLASGAIPDAAMIHAARKKRQRARELGDFIAVEDAEDKPEPPGGRLQREDPDDVDASDDEEQRIDMGANPLKRDQERRREQFYEAAASADVSDPEHDEWEDQQIRKGVTGSAYTQELLYQEYHQAGETSRAKSKQSAAMASKMAAGVPRTPEAILEKMREQYQTALGSQQKHEEQLARIRRDLANAAEELESLRIAAPKAAEKFRFYQELRGYITDLVECLDEKVGLITELEQKALELLARKSAWAVERRRQDVRDQADEVTNLSKKSLGQKSMDDPEKSRRAVEREGRRTRRRRLRETTGGGGGGAELAKHVEGMSSDDEQPQQITLAFDTERDLVESQAAEVFDDVVEDFSSIANILIHFEQWREADMDAYRDAYATFCLPKVVAPLIRLHVLMWDPLNDTVDLEKAPWYRTLALYGLHDDETEVSLGRDPDLHLLPTIFEKVIVPKISLIVDRCWDPLSSAQTLKLVGLIGRYIRKYPSLAPDSKSLNALFNIVLRKLREALEHDVFIPIMPRFAETKNPFFQRQFASGLKLLKNITSWQGLLNDNTLKELAITSLLNRYLISAIRICKLTDAVAKIQLVALILPRVWLSAGEGERSHLEMFTYCVLSFAQQLDKENPLHLESTEILAGILKTLKC